MSAVATKPSDAETLSPQIASLERDAVALTAALASSRRTRLLLLLAVVAFVGITCIAFYRLFSQFIGDEQRAKLQALAEKELHDRQDYLMKEVQTLVNSSTPIVSAAFAEQAKKDLPGFMRAAGAERDALVQNLQAKLEERLHAHHEKLLARHEKMLHEEFPAVKDDKLHAAMMANLMVAVDKLVRKYYIDEMSSEMQGMYKSWDEFPIAPPRAEGDDPLEDQLVANLMELLKTKLSETHPPAP